MVVDSKQHIVFWNRGAERLFGRRASRVLGRRCREIVEGRDVFGNRCCYAGCMPSVMVRNGETVQKFEMQVHGNGGGNATLRITSTTVDGDESSPPVVVHTFEDSGVPDHSPPLSRREREILGLVAVGLQNKEIAQKLGVSLATIRNHVHNILEKLGLHSKLEAVALAFRSGWV
jgi:DNA-binding CsgD family transcriptional regulator